MASYLFITDPEIYAPEAIKKRPGTWSCSKKTAKGDTALVYLTGGQGISYEWEVLSDAYPDDEWFYECEVKLVQKIDPPISLKVIWNLVPRKIWAAPYTHFRGYRSIRIPDQAAKILQSLYSAKRRRR